MTLALSREEIAAAVQRLASQISHDYRGKKPLLVGVLRGAFVFLADLVRELDIPVQVDFVRLSSYGKDHTSSGRVKVLHRLHSRVNGRDVLIVEDIVDTGLTTAWLIEYLRRKQPASVKLCALLNKEEGRKTFVPIDYVGFVVPNHFLVGYGLDSNQDYRQQPQIYVLEEDGGP
ncbi:MAG: hypoxanthine phosphoribosyltransferase [Chloroflexota bacterium]|nr:hypoxanthine phosphoribosyltransferase [Chloroflexota bacterium]